MFFIPFKIEDIEGEGRWKPLLCSLLCVSCLLFGAFAFRLLSKEALEDLNYSFGAVALDFKWWSPISCAFLHGGWLHLLGNVYFLWIYGSALEKVIGPLRFIAIYVAGAFFSVWAHVLTVPSWLADDPAIGASGAISAVLGAFLVFLPGVRIRFLVYSPLYPRPLPSHAPAHFVLGFWFIVQIAYGLKLVGDQGQVAFWAHIAGFGAGALMAWLFLQLSKLFKSPSEDGLGEDDGDGEASLEASRAAFSKGDEELSLRLAVAAFAKAKADRDPGRTLQLYVWLLCSCEESKIPSWLHRDSAHAALRMKEHFIALHAFSKAAAGNAIDDPERSLAAFKVALERAGEPGLVEKAAALQAKLFPGTTAAG